MVVGVLCGISYSLIKLSGLADAAPQVNNLLMYAGIITITVGLIIFGASRLKSQ
jgi:hypothetical protein